MCGRYTLTYTWQEIHDDLDAYINLGQIPVTDVVAKAPPRFTVDHQCAQRNNYGETGLSWGIATSSMPGACCWILRMAEVT